MSWPTTQKQIDERLLTHQGAKPRFFLDDDSGEPWQLFGDVENIALAAENFGATVRVAIDNLLTDCDGGVVLRIKRRDMTDSEVDELPEL